jgi:hypothetical protein
MLEEALGASARALELAGSSAGRGRAAHAGLAYVDALAEIGRIVSSITLRNAGTLSIGVLGFS